MNYNWYNLFNLTEFEETGLVSRTITTSLLGIGSEDVLITKGFQTCITYKEALLKINDQEVFSFGGYATYLDENADVWLGVPA